MSKLELRNIIKRYGSFTAVDGVSLSVEDGEVVSLLGPSGCGKTTTLNMLAGFLNADSGEILVDGRGIQNLPPERRNTGMVFQSYALFPHMTVADNIGFGLRMRKVERPEIARRVNTVVELARLGGLHERYPRQLSGGQQQRVALARALVIEPSLLLLDEPLSNLDANLREEMRFEIREIQRRVGITTIFVTHDQTEAMAISDRLAVMNKGRVRQVGTPGDVYRTPADVFVAGFIGQASLLPGTISALNGGASVRLAEGNTVIVSAGGKGVAVGDAVKVVVRPEDIGIALEPVTDRNCLKVSITELTYLGASTRVVGTAAGVEVIAATNRPPSGLAPGAEVYLVWDPAHCAIVPAEDPDTPPQQ